MSADTETIREALREEWEALGHVSLHAHEEQNDIWWADLTGDDIATIRALLNDAAAALGRVEDELRLTREILWMTVTEDDHECQGYCPDAGSENSRDPNCAACRAMDLPDSPLMAEFTRALFSSAAGSGEE